MSIFKREAKVMTIMLVGPFLAALVVALLMPLAFRLSAYLHH